MRSERLEHRDGAAARFAGIDDALARGEIDEEGWHEAVVAIVVPGYLAAETPWGQSGKSGDEATWEQARRPVAHAIDRDGCFLDVGCASGFLMESVQRWTAERGLAVEPYGLEIAPELAELARRRLPHWADRIFVGNARRWSLPRRFDFVRTGLDYAPPGRRRELVEHLLEHVVAPHGRLIVGVYSQDRDARPTDELVASWGFEIGGRIEAAHRDPSAAYRLFWIDA
jgi:SAM-dependent methyltransferase